MASVGELLLPSLTREQAEREEREVTHREGRWGKERGGFGLFCARTFTRREGPQSVSRPTAGAKDGREDGKEGKSRPNLWSCRHAWAKEGRETTSWRRQWREEKAGIQQPFLGRRRLFSSFPRKLSGPPILGVSFAFCLRTGSTWFPPSPPPPASAYADYIFPLAFSAKAGSFPISGRAGTTAAAAAAEAEALQERRGKEGVQRFNGVACLRCATRGKGGARAGDS
jgi:hypothetical protein